MKNLMLIAVVAFSLLFLSSCDAVYTYEYRVKNISDTSAMQLHYHFKGDSVATATTLVPGEEKLICVTSHGVEAHKGPYNTPVANYVDSVIVIKNGVRTTKNLLLDDNWIYSVSHSTGLYNATISDSEF